MPRLDFEIAYNQGHDLKLPLSEMMAAKEAGSPISKHYSFQDAKRAQFSILTPLEKKVLGWLVQRVPEGVNSDHLTAIGFLGMAFAGASFWLARWNHLGYLLAILCLAVNWFGDSLDGTLARTRNHLRPKYGFYVDHMVDTFGALLLLGGMMLSGCMSPAVGAGLLIAYFILAIEIYLATYTLGTFHLSFWKMGPTELRVVLAIGCLGLHRGSNLHLAGAAYRLFDVGGVVAIAGLLVTAIASTVRHTGQLYRAEPIQVAMAAGGRKSTRA
ncbi:MAG TPA: CDP-alcohol phosphatidyltransferase family protein [Terriglobia bacterium]|nr:CDP-alcohol phosphatidyltransferase family protein [Terriglobia bacterium]